jgi:hypothetical protein
MFCKSFETNFYFFFDRKGALLLFSEEFVSDKTLKKNNDIDYDDLPIKTVSEFQKNVLFYGIGQKQVRNSVIVWFF